MLEIWTRFPRRVGNSRAVMVMRPAAASSRRALRAELEQQPHFSAMVGTAEQLCPCRLLTRKRYAKTSFARGLMRASNRSARMQNVCRFAMGSSLLFGIILHPGRGLGFR